MIRSISALAVLGAALLLGACSTPVETTVDVLRAEGPITNFAGPQGATPEALFMAAYTKAFTVQKAAYESGAALATDDQPYRNLASAGFGLVKTYCSDFFRRKGEAQKWMRFGTDAVAAAGALATGVLAITGTSALAVSIVALSTTTAAGSISIYEKNFLFGAENIDSVRVLTLNALSSNAARAMTVEGPWDFQFALNAILVNQELCKPASILRLTREAIVGSSVRSSLTQTTDEEKKQDGKQVQGSARTQAIVTTNAVGGTSK